MDDNETPTTRVSKIPRERIERTRELYLQGVPNLAIQSKLSREFNVSCRAVRTWIKIVVDKLGRAESANTEAARARASEMLLNAYLLARGRKGYTKDGPYDDPDVKAMVAAAHRYAELHGAVGPKRVELSGPNGGPVPTRAEVVILPPLEAIDASFSNRPMEAESGAANAVPGDDVE